MAAVGAWLGRRGRATVDALERLVRGLATAVLALLALVAVLLCLALCLVGVGVPLTPVALRGLRAVADRERARLLDAEPPAARPVPPRLLAAVTDRGVGRELAWAAGHATFGLALGLVAMTLPLNVLRDGSFPLWWRLVPPADATSSLGLWTVHDGAGAALVGLMGLGWVAVAMVLLPPLAWLQAVLGRRLLAYPGDDPALRIATLTATRAAALEAHVTELRRIERALHDGTQNRLVAVAVLLGAARRAAVRDPAGVDAVLGRAQEATEAALADLRGVVRSILPPVLADRSLADALASLAADCPVPCELDLDVPAGCPASVAATVYFAAAEALTNVAKHSGAGRAGVRVRSADGAVRLRVTDDGHGGAEARPGSGLEGIRRRVAAHDGAFDLTSPAGGPTTLEVSVPCGS